MAGGLMVEDMVDGVHGGEGNKLGQTRREGFRPANREREEGSFPSEYLNFVTFV